MLGFFPISSGPLSEILDAQVTQTTTTTVRFASRTITTRATDSPANTSILGKITRGLRVERQLEIVEDGQFGAIAETTYGEVVLNNADGELDALASRFAADGRQVRLRIGATEMLSVPARLGLWSAKHEGGTFDEWGTGTGASGGGFFNSGNADVEVSTEQAYSGVFSMKMTIDTTAAVDTAVRAFRWQEAFTGRDLYYSGRYYLPVHHVPATFWNIMQFKSEVYDSNGVLIANNPIFTVGLDNDGAGGALRVHAFYFGTVFGGSDVQFNQALADIPIGAWVKLEAFLHQAENATGIFRLWQDDVLIIEATGLQTKYVNGFNSWSINSYSNGLTPPVAIVFVDDAAITYDTMVDVEREQPYAQFATVYISTSGGWNTDHDVLRLRVEGLNNRLQDKLQNATYAGLGGIEGSAEIAGHTKPLLFGRCSGGNSNVTPQLLDPAILTYQVHNGNIESIDAVYDGGAGGAHDSGTDFVFAGDYPSYAALVAATVPAGSYATSLAVGCLRLGIAPQFGVTVDARGHKDNITGNYIETTADIIRTTLRDYAGISTDLIDHTAFNSFNGLQPGDVGIFLPAGDQSTVTDFIRRLAFGAGAIFGERAGIFTIQRLDPPSPTIVHWAFSDRDILDNRIRRLDLPYRIPWKAWGVGYGVNWTIQTAADLAGAVTQTRRTYLQSERRFSYVQSPSIAEFHATSHGAPLRDSFFASAAVAAAEAQRLLGLYSYGRALYEIVVKTALFSVHIGQVVRITYHRWDMDGGKNYVVVGVSDDADSVETTLLVFG